MPNTPTPIADAAEPDAELVAVFQAAQDGPLSEDHVRTLLWHLRRNAAQHAEWRQQRDRLKADSARQYAALCFLSSALGNPCVSDPESLEMGLVREAVRRLEEARAALAEFHTVGGVSNMSPAEFVLAAGKERDNALATLTAERAKGNWQGQHELEMARARERSLLVARNSLAQLLRELLASQRDPASDYQINTNAGCAIVEALRAAGVTL